MLVLGIAVIYYFFPVSGNYKVLFRYPEIIMFKYPKIKRFCLGIRKLQCILLKTALCFGVEVFGGVEYQGKLRA